MRGTAALTTATNRVEAERNVSQRSRGRQDKLNAQTGLTKTMTCSAAAAGGDSWSASASAPSWTGGWSWSRWCCAAPPFIVALVVVFFWGFVIPRYCTVMQAAVSKVRRVSGAPRSNGSAIVGRGERSDSGPRNWPAVPLSAPAHAAKRKAGRRQDAGTPT